MKEGLDSTVTNTQPAHKVSLVSSNKKSGDGPSLRQLCNLRFASCSSSSTGDLNPLEAAPSRLRIHIQGKRERMAQGTKSKLAVPVTLKKSSTYKILLFRTGSPGQP